MRLLLKLFSENAEPPKFIKPKKQPEKGDWKVNVALFRNGWCQTMNIACERAKRASLEFPGKINLQIYDTTDKELVKEWGFNDAMFIDGKEINIGPAPSYEKLRRKIEKRVSKI